MKSGLVLLSGMLVGLSTAAWAEPGDPVVAPAPAVVEARPVPEKPKPPVAVPVAQDKPKPVERPAPPRPHVEAPKPAPAARPAESPATEAAQAASAAAPAACSETLACWLVGFAMLVIGFAAGFIARHLVSRRKLGGMTVRIGTWRGIP